MSGGFTRSELAFETVIEAHLLTHGWRRMPETGYDSLNGLPGARWS